MDLNSYIQLKEAYSQVGKPQQLNESVDSIWEEVEAFAHALVEEEGMDLSDMTWDEVREAYLEESRLTGQQRAAARTERRAAQQAARDKSQAEYKAGGGDAGVAQRTKPAGGSRARFNTKNRKAAEIAVRAQGRKNLDAKNNKPLKPIPADKRPKDMQQGKVYGDASPTKPQPQATKPQPQATKPQPQAAKPSPDRMAGASKADRMGAWAKANPKLAAAQKQRAATKSTSATSNPMMKDLAKRMPKPAAPKPSGGGLSAVKPQSFKSSVAAGSAMKSAASKPAPKPAAKPAAPSFGAGIKAGSMLKKEESEFDIILTHLIEQGFGDDEALKLMVNMPEEKRVEILEMRHRDAKTGEVTDKPEIGKTYYSHGERQKSSVALRKEKEAEEKKTRKEEDESLYQAYLSMMSEEDSDKRKDSDLEKGGHAARTDYSKPPATGNDFGKKKPMSDEDRKEAMAKVAAKLKKQGGK